MHFYYFPSRKVMILWSEKCACTSLVQWIKNNFEELSECQGKPRSFLNKNRYNYNSLHESKQFHLDNIPVDHLIISHRDPIKRMASSFVSKFLMRGDPAHILPLKPKKLQRFSKEFLEIHHSLDNLKKQRVIKHNKIRRFNLEATLFNLSLKKFITTLVNPMNDLVALNSHFSPQIINQEQWTDFMRIVDHAKRVYPLRVETFNQDLLKINQCIGFDNHQIEKKNATCLPNDQWKFSDEAETSTYKTAKLCSLKLVPNGTSLQRLLESNSSLYLKFKDTFKYDYQLSQYLEKFSSPG